MSLTIRKPILAGGAVVFAAIVMPVEAQAFWRSSSSYGSSASYGSASSGSWSSHGSSSSASSSSYSSYSSHGSSSSSSASHGSSSAGPFRRLFRRVHSSHGSSSSSSVSYGSSSSSSASHGGSSSSSSVIHHHTPVIHHAPVIHHGSSSGHGSYSSHSVISHGVVTSTTVAKPVVASGSGTLNVTVPAGAKVFVNDNATSTDGVDRQYVSHGLKQGQSYTYNVRVEYEKDGRTVVEKKAATLSMNGNVRLTFGSDAAAVAEKSDEAETDETKLTLNVPAGASVTLAGAKTRQTGEVRQYLTTALATGQEWEDYAVQVEHKVNGKMVSQVRRITLRGGESHELTFDFANAGLKLASAN